jgi:hypothetical protein
MKFPILIMPYTFSEVKYMLEILLCHLFVTVVKGILFHCVSCIFQNAKITRCQVHLAALLAETASITCFHYFSEDSSVCKCDF